MSSVTIVGGGIGGFTVANELRSGGYDGGIAIIDPLGHPYDRPPLSKEVLAGTKQVEDLEFVPRSWYTDNNVEVVASSAARIDVDGKQLFLADGSTHPYDKLVIATGGKARRGSTPGYTDPAVHVLRTTEDALRLREHLREGTRLGIIGAGLIGAEVASSACLAGADVTLIDPAPIALIPAVGEELATRLHDLHANNNVKFINGMPTTLTKTEDGFTVDIDGHEDRVTLDQVLLSIGIEPNLSLAKSAELECDGGILVNHRQQTSREGIWAVGDCARVRNDDGSLERRHEHWDSAVQEGQAAAASILGTDAPAESASWFWSDRYGIHLEGTGSMTDEGSTVVRRDANGEPDVVFRVAPDSTLAGAAAFNDSKAIRAARRIIDRRITVNPTELEDPAVALKKLAR